MKKNLLLFPCLLLFHTINGQILSRTEVWPDSNWTFSGTFTSAALLMNPTTTDSQFKYDTSLVTPSGGSTDLFLSSPTIDLKPAFDGGEKGLELSFDIAFQTFSIDILGADYWDADTGQWELFPEGTAEIETLGDFQNCTLVNVSIFLDISSFTTNQLQNFRYEIFIEDPGGQITGVCMAAPTLKSLSSCVAPSNFITTNINKNDVDFDWTPNGIEAYWEIAYSLQGEPLIPNNNFITSHPTRISFLTANTSYDAYVRADCSDGDGIINSNWVGPLTFTTATLSLEEFSIDKLKIAPNPTHGLLELNLDGANIYEVSLFSLTGQRLYDEKFNQSRVNLDLTSFKTGLYFLKIFTDKGTGVYKVIKD